MLNSINLELPELGVLKVIGFKKKEWSSELNSFDHSFTF